MINTELERKNVLGQICSASLQGTLGLFAGAGLTKAILENNTEYCAYNWGELLEMCCEKMNVDIDKVMGKGSYPELASNICKQHSVRQGIDIRESVSLLKKTIAKSVTVYPEEEVQRQYSGYFEELNFNWVVTTNYDTMVEYMLPGKAFPLSPQDNFVKINNLTLVYHIHGIKTNADSIIITNEDYVSVFRPNDYRQSRLPFLIKESLVLMVGYGFGDINVITAVDWSKNVYTNVREGYDFPIIQLLYKDDPKDEPYYDSTSIIVVETSSITDFFNELMEILFEYHETYNEKIKQVCRRTTGTVSIKCFG